VIAADLDGKKAALAALERMASHYKAAYEHSSQRDPYPQLNWLTASVLLSVIDPSVKALRGIRQMIEKARAAAKEQQLRAPDFWNAVMSADCLLLEHLAARDLAGNTDKIISGYMEVKTCIGSPREFRSVLEHLDFLANIMAMAPEEETAKSMCAALSKIRGALA